MLKGKFYLPLDVSYFDDDRVVELSDGAQLLDIRAMVLMKRLRTDGSLTKRQLERIAPTSPRIGCESGGDVGEIAPMIGELISSGLWCEINGQITRGGWSEWNNANSGPDQAAKSGAFGNHQRWHVKRKVVQPGCPFCIAPDSGRESPPDSLPDSPTSLSKRREEKNKTYDADFEEWWTAYPWKKNAAKNAARKAYGARRNADISAETLLAAAKHYAETKAGSDSRFIMLGSTFLGPTARYEDFIEAPAGPYDTPPPVYT